MFGRIAPRSRGRGHGIIGSLIAMNRVNPMRGVTSAGCRLGGHARSETGPVIAIRTMIGIDIAVWSRRSVSTSMIAMIMWKSRRAMAGVSLMVAASTAITVESIGRFGHAVASSSITPVDGSLERSDRVQGSLPSITGGIRSIRIYNKVPVLVSVLNGTKGFQITLSNSNRDWFFFGHGQGRISLGVDPVLSLLGRGLLQVDLPLGSGALQTLSRLIAHEAENRLGPWPLGLFGDSSHIDVDRLDELDDRWNDQHRSRGGE